MQAGKGVGTSVSRLWTGNARSLIKTAVCFPLTVESTRYDIPGTVREGMYCTKGVP